MTRRRWALVLAGVVAVLTLLSASLPVLAAVDRHRPPTPRPTPTARPTPTPTFTPTPTPAPTSSASSTPPASPSAVPTGVQLKLTPACGGVRFVATSSSDIDVEVWWVSDTTGDAGRFSQLLTLTAGVPVAGAVSTTPFDRQVDVGLYVPESGGPLGTGELAAGQVIVACP